MADGFRYDLIPSGVTVLCALSGGADSMYLLCRLMEGAPAGGYAVCAAHYNHKLRPASDEEEIFVRNWCAARQIPLVVGQGCVSAEAERLGKGVEETARDMRYAFLRQAAAETGCSLIATGHHAGDNAETVLMNLIRGCGLGGLAGIPLRREELIRPMLAINRNEILSCLDRHGIPHVEDESNGDPAYTRNSVRHRLIPLLEELNPRAVEHINALGARAAEDEALLRSMAEDALRQCSDTPDGTLLPVQALTGVPGPIALRMVKLLVPTAQSVHLEQIMALCSHPSPSAAVDVPGGVTVRRVYADLLFCTRHGQPPAAAPLREGRQHWGDWVIVCAQAVCPRKAYVSREEFYLTSGVYHLRSRQEGDGLKLGRRPWKTIKELMIEQRVPRHARDTVPVLADGSGSAAAAGGLGPHWAALAQPGETCLHIIIKRGE